MKLTSVRKRYPKMVEVTTPYEGSPFGDESAIVMRVQVVEQSFARGSILHIGTVESSGRTEPAFVWPVEAAVERTRGFGTLVSDARSLVALLGVEPLSDGRTDSTVLEHALAKLFWNAGFVVLDCALALPPNATCRVHVTGDPENRPIKVRLAGFAAYELGKSRL